MVDRDAELPRSRAAAARFCDGQGRRALLAGFVLHLVGCGPPSQTDPITIGGVTIQPVQSFSAMPRVTDENVCVEEPLVFVTDQDLGCEAYAANGGLVLEGENRFVLKFNRGSLEERAGTYEVLGGFLERPPRQVFVSAVIEGVTWRGFKGSAEIFSFDESGAAVRYSLEIEERSEQAPRANVGGGIVAEHCPALQDALNRC